MEPTKEQITLLDLVFSDIFCDIQKYLHVNDLFTLRCVSVNFRDYIDKEIVNLKKIQFPTKDAKVMKSFKVLCKKCCNLETINLGRQEWLRDELLIPMLEKNTKSLVSLNLNNCPNLSSVSLHFIINCNKLKKLSLQNCLWLTVGCLETIAFHQNNLEELDLTNCKVISERSIIILLNSFRKLRILSLASVSNVNDNILFNISKYQTKIEHLNLFSCHLISDRGIGALSLNCRRLESLSIRGCGNITERSLILLRARNVHIDVPRNSTTAINNQFQRLDIFNNLYLQV